MFGGRVRQMIPPLVLVLALAALCNAQGPVGGERPAGQSSGSQLSAQDLLAQEQRSPTTAGTVQERFQQLKSALSVLIQAGRSVRDILSREDAEAIDALLRSGSTDESARRVHDAILRLGSQNSSAGQLDQKGTAGAGMQTGATQGGTPQAGGWQTGATQGGAPQGGGWQAGAPQGGTSQGGGWQTGTSQGATPQAGGWQMGGRQNGELGRFESPAATAPLGRWNIHQLATGDSFANILKLTNPALDSRGRRLYVCGTKSTAIGVIDMTTDQLIETFDVGDVPCGYLVFDQKSRTLYSQEIGGGNRIYAIDVHARRAEARDRLPSTIELPRRTGTHRGATRTYKGLNYTDTGYPFEVGYLQQENASYGVIEITDQRGREVGKILHGPDALYFDIDEETGKLYTTNTGDGSVSVFDLNDRGRKIKDIDVGTSVDEIQLNPRTGGLYVRNRLGGSTLFSLDPRTAAITTVPNENSAARGIGLWPTRMILDDDRLFVLSHYDARIDIVDAATTRVLGRIPLRLSFKPRTDGISTMAMDKKRKILYAAFPELGEIAVADAKAGTWIRTIKIENYDTTRIDPARIALAVDEAQGRLLCSLSEEKSLNIYRGPDYAVETISSINGQQVGRIQGVNNDQGVFYMGNRVIDLRTLEVRGTFPRGNRVVGFNNEKNRVYVVEMTQLGPGQMLEKVYEFEGLMLTKQWTMSSAMSIPSSFAFDFKHNRFYVGYFESAQVEEFDLAGGSAPSESPRSAQRGQANPADRGNQSTGARGGRCGDGICQPIEKEKGVCPADCK